MDHVEKIIPWTVPWILRVIRTVTLPKTNIAPKIWWFPIGISFSKGLFSGAKMLVSGRVYRGIPTWFAKKCGFNPNLGGEAHKIHTFFFGCLFFFSKEMLYLPLNPKNPWFESQEPMEKWSF